MGRFSEAEAPLRRALRVAPRHDKVRRRKFPPESSRVGRRCLPFAVLSQAARKLRQLGAEQLRPTQAEFEAEQQVAALEMAVDACADDSACLQAQTAETDARREADGPLVV